MKQPDEAPWSRPEKLALLVFAPSILVSLALLVHARYDAIRNGSIYIGTAKLLLVSEGVRYLGVPYFAHGSGLSALIARCWRRLPVPLSRFAGDARRGARRPRLPAV